MQEKCQTFTAFSAFIFNEVVKGVQKIFFDENFFLIQVNFRYLSTTTGNHNRIERYQFMTYYTVREFVLPCITCNEKMHFQVVIKAVNAIYQSKSNEYNATSKIQ